LIAVGLHWFSQDTSQRICQRHRFRRFRGKPRSLFQDNTERGIEDQNAFLGLPHSANLS
jgi:hypothetical protein